MRGIITPKFKTLRVYQSIRGNINLLRVAQAEAGGAHDLHIQRVGCGRRAPSDPAWNPLAMSLAVMSQKDLAVTTGSVTLKRMRRVAAEVVLHLKPECVNLFVQMLGVIAIDLYTQFAVLSGIPRHVHGDPLARIS